MEKVAVLMSTFNGESFIEEQIDSILQQDGVRVELFIRDDGSGPLMVQKLRGLTSLNPNIHLRLEHNVGYKRSYYQLVEEVSDQFQWYAFADQDDVWLPDKLITCIGKNKREVNKPVLVYHNARLFSDAGEMGKLYAHPVLTTSFLDLMYRPLYGMSLVFNHSLMTLLKSNDGSGFDFLAHDGWAAVVAAYSGSIEYIDMCLVRYRQTASNKSGYKETSGPVTIKHLLRRLISIKVDVRKWNSRLSRALEIIFTNGIQANAVEVEKISSQIRSQQCVSNRLRLVLNPKFTMHSLYQDVILRLLAFSGHL